ncbi:hypothetical protein L596_005452 [Steinernema carpocapsae]|uniref:Uncharacterized protein n=1 Tax=Steinernema carpocapsae TaxID=34508 RepID=A0A4U8UZ57_STECR|nr:hypothetical protein L596_005452 [Steinernema carpocapsae]
MATSRISVAVVFFFFHSIAVRSEEKKDSRATDAASTTDVVETRRDEIRSALIASSPFLHSTLLVFCTAQSHSN